MLFGIGTAWASWPTDPPGFPSINRAAAVEAAARILAPHR
jgi:hypothetical protein